MKKETFQNTFLFFRFICLMTSVQIIFTNNVIAEQNTIFVSTIQPDLRFNRITDEDGLYQKFIYTIYQDSQDFLWLGTEGGLVRYDGYNFKVFSNDPFDKNSISHNQIIAIYEDKSNRLWISTNGGGLNLFDRDTEIFYRFKHDPSNSNSLWGDVLGTMCEDKSGALWVVSSNRLNKINFIYIDTMNSISETKKNNSLINKDNLKYHVEILRWKPAPQDGFDFLFKLIWDILVDRYGSLWVGTYEGVFKIDNPQNVQRDVVDSRSIHSLPSPVNKNRVTNFVHDPKNQNSLLDNGAKSLLEDSNGNLWIATVTGLNLYDRDNNNFVRYPFDTNVGNKAVIHPYRIYFDQNNNIWAATYSGLALFNVHKKKYSYYIHNPDDPYSLSFDGIFSVCEDKSGIIWVGTNGKGLNKCDPKFNQFCNFRAQWHKEPFQSVYNIRTLFEDSQTAGFNLWVATDKLYRIDRSTGDIKLENFYWEDGSTPLLNKIIQAQNGIFWLASEDGLYQYFPQTGKFLHIKCDPTDPHSLKGERTFFVFEDKLGQIWTATLGVLHKWLPESGGFLHYELFSKSMGNITLGMIQDKDGIFWIVGNRGLYRFDENNRSVRSYINDPENSFSISYDHIFCIKKDPYQPDHFLWLGTAGGGLNRFDKETEKFIRYTEKDGLPDNTIYGILADEKGNLWMSTNKGLTKAILNPSNSTVISFKNYDKSNGLQTNIFTSGAYFKNNKAELFFGGVDGFNIFHPSQIKDNKHVPAVFITDFRIRNKSISPLDLFSPLKRAIAQTKEIFLPYNFNDISFELSALDFTSPHKNQYAYKLENYNKDWIQLGTERLVHFTNLSPRKYIFRAKGSNNDGVWNEQGTSIRIIITPPWWKTWWAYAIYVILILSAIFGLRSYENNRRELKHKFELEHVETEKLHELHKMKSRFFANISHEFRTPLTLILGPIEKLLAFKNKPEYKRALSLVQRNTKRLLQFVNQILDLSKLESGKIKLQASYANIVQFIKGITMSFDSLAMQKNVTLKVEAGNEKIDIYFDGDKIEKIFTNLLSNAIKFTAEGGKITVNISKDESVKIAISDTGIGISANDLPFIFDRFYQIDSSSTRQHGGTGIGLALVKELVELHYGSIGVDSEEDKGTTFTIYLPLGKDHLEPDEISDTTVEFLSQGEIQAAVYPEIIDEEKIDHDFFAQEMETAKEYDINETIILVIDDNAEVRTYIREHLESKYKVIEASDGEDGIRAAMEIIPDLVLSDVMMPKKNGYEVCQTIKTDEKTSHIPVILLTAKAAAEEKLEGLETGADDYIIKPFDSKELVIRIKNLIELRRKLRQRFSRITMLKPSELDITSVDKKFLQRLLDIVESHLSEETFGVEELCKEIGMSSPSLWRKIHGLLNKNPNQFIRSVRLQHAKRMIEQNAGNIAEITYAVGFNNTAYFAKCFRDQFDKPPSFFKGKKAE